MSRVKRHLKHSLQRGVKWAARLGYPIYLLLDLFRKEEEVRVLMYHKVSNLPPERQVPYCNVPISSFESQMKYLSESEIDVLPLERLESWVRGDRKGGNRKKVAITFDDGFQDNYLCAYPILKKYRLPAAFFVIVDYVGQGRFFDHLQWDEPSLADRERDPARWLPMTWEMLREMKRNGMSIGSHTMSHRSLSNLTAAEIWYETAQSKKILEDRLQAEVSLFSYPFGSPNYGDFNEATEAALKESGYALACTTGWGANRAGEAPYRLKRIPVYDHDTLFDFKMKVHGGADWIEKCKNLWQRFVLRSDKVDFEVHRDRSLNMAAQRSTPEE